MVRQVYINGEFQNENEAKISVFDRGLLFSDSLYEVTTVINGKLIDFHSHMKRLDRSMTELKFSELLDHDNILAFHKKLIEFFGKNEINKITDCLINTDEEGNSKGFGFVQFEDEVK